ncbi:MAG: DNA glycosylase AlkZ-like family protein, partial [Actinomycetes bacterium]
MKVIRDRAVERRIAAQQLDAPPGTRAALDAAVLDLGVQDTGRDGASWALANRGVDIDPDRFAAAEELALVWTLRASPHVYRRKDLPDVAVATSPYSDADAAKRIVGAGKPMKEAGIAVRSGL